VAAITALQSMGDATAVDPLLTVLGDKDRSVRESAVCALGAMGGGRAMEPLIMALIDDFTRAGALVALNRIDPAWRKSETADKTLYRIIPSLKDATPAMRAGAAWTLGELGDARAIEPLVAALVEKDENVWARVRDALTKIDPDWRGNKAAAGALPYCLTGLGNTDAALRKKAAWILGTIGDARAVAPLIMTLADKDADVRAQAAWALGAIGDGQAVEPLLAALKDTDPGVRASAAEALGQIGDKKAVPPLIDALIDKNPQARKALAAALKKITGQDFGEDQVRWKTWWEGNK
jgi:HEAT repeat protein